MPFTTVTNRTGPHSVILAEHHNEIIDYLNGTRNELARLVSDDADQYGVIIRNLGAGSKALLVQDNAGVTLLDISSSGAVLGFADGSAALPSIRFADDSDTGLYSSGPNEVSITTGGTQVLEARQQVVKIPGSIMVGQAEPEGTGEVDHRHQLYLAYDATGAMALDSPGLSMVDQVLAVTNINSSTDWDFGSILGVCRNTGGTGKVSMRALAGQLFKYSATNITADSQALEIGVHNAKSQVSHADNPAPGAADAFYGTCGITILSYGGDQAGGAANPGVRSNTAILIGSIGGTNSGFKQAVVYYDTDQGTKLWEVNQRGNQLSGAGPSGSNASEVAYGVGSITNGMFSGGVNVVAFSTNGVERARLDASANLCLGTTSVGGASKALALGNAITPPSSNPTSGGVLYSEGGVLKWRGSSGTITTVAPA